ncbi:MAG: LEA type 2 family protein [Bacteroidota bacterium]
MKGDGVLKRSSLWLALFSLIFLSSCQVEEIELIEIEKLKLQQFSADGIVIDVTAKISNPNSFTISVSDSDFDVYVNDRFISKAKIDSNVKLKRKTTASHSFTIKSDKLKSQNEILPILLQAALTGKVKGKVKGYVKGKTFLFFSRKVDFELEEDLEISNSLLNG